MPKRKLEDLGAGTLKKNLKRVTIPDPIEFRCLTLLNFLENTSTRYYDYEKEKTLMFCCWGSKSLGVSVLSEEKYVQGAIDPAVLVTSSGPHCRIWNLTVFIRLTLSTPLSGAAPSQRMNPRCGLCGFYKQQKASSCPPAAVDPMQMIY
ncbi:hypothetical protein Y1Q_0013397 [Alligator mississippiensis]|uniref:Uncharacterized protein n=1 Tax=Alligator mississippiensis TaxID=8496 RepID=A0A151NV91_ALLMI|nr:hypothetical protein Y1Q_0013397 [Alligator mississippiensis]